MITLPILLGRDGRNDDETEKFHTPGGPAERGDQRKGYSPWESTGGIPAVRGWERVDESKPLDTDTFFQKVDSMISQTALCSDL